MRSNRTDYNIEVEFLDDITQKTQIVDVLIPYEIFVDSLREWSSRFNAVDLNGTDTHIWNLFADLNALDTVAEDENFLSICREKYYTSLEYEEDYDEWKEDRNEYWR